MRNRRTPMVDGHMTGSPMSRRTAIASPLAAAPWGSAGRAISASAIDEADIHEPLGISLETWPYPGPVSFLPLVMGRENVRMAYMDFAPTASGSGRAIFLLHGKNFDSSY